MMKSMHKGPSLTERLEPRTLFAAGDPLEMFGIGGMVQLRGNRTVGEPIAFAETASDKLLFTSYGSKIARLNKSDGSLDTTFAGDGIAETYFSGLRATAPTDGDRVWAVGYLEDGDPATPITWHLSQLRSDGSLDRSLGRRGRVDIDAALLRPYRNLDWQVDSAGTAFASATLRADPTQRVLLRFGNDGKLDQTFADAGVLPLRTSRGSFSDTQFDSSGRLYQMVGAVRDGKVSATVRSIRRLNPDGSLDTTFGSGGYLVARSDLQFRNLFIFDDALFIHAPVTQQKSSYLLKLDLNGQFDAGFGNGGKIKFQLPERYAWIRLFRQADGKLLMRSVVWKRLNADGSIDPTLDTAAIPGRHVVAGRDGVLYGASAGEVYATALTGDATGPSSLSADGTLTLRGTRQADHLDLSESIYPYPGGTRVVSASREGWARTYSPDAVKRIVIDAGSGDDKINARASLPMTVIGAAGNDVMRVFSNTVGTIISGGLGDDDIEVSGESYRVNGDDGNDAISGRVGDDVNDRQPGRSTLSGGRGDDTLRTSGGRGLDAFELFGDTGNDLLQSFLTNDTLTGGPGRDTLRGGEGDDVLVGDDDDAA